MQILRLQLKLCHTWEEGGGPAFGGVLIYPGSSSMSQPALLPYDPSAFWLLLPFFSAACSLHTSEATWWVAFTKNQAGLTWAVSVNNFFMMCVPHRASNVELMTLWSAKPLILTIYVKRSKVCEACLWTYCESVGFSLNVSLRKWFADRKESFVFERACSRRGFASKMEEALFVLQTCSERIPWGGLSCANLFHNDWNAAEPKPWKLIGQPTARCC